MHCWWECKFIDHYGEQHGDSLNKLGIKLSYDLAIQLLGIYPEKTINQNYNASKNVNKIKQYLGILSNEIQNNNINQHYI